MLAAGQGIRHVRRVSELVVSGAGPECGGDEPLPEAAGSVRESGAEGWGDEETEGGVKGEVILLEEARAARKAANSLIKRLRWMKCVHCTRRRFCIPSLAWPVCCRFPMQPAEDGK